MKRRVLILFSLVGILVVLQGFQNCSGVQKSVSFSNDESSLDVVDQDIPDEVDPDPNAVPHLVQDTVQVAPTANAVDVLVVMDNSGSMKVEQANMASRFSNFISKLNGLDWHMGIITTDVAADANLKDGRLVQFKNTTDYFLSSTMSSTTVDSAFTSSIQFATTGSGKEQGIAATSRFVDRYLDSAAINDSHRAMIRSNAAFAVVVITDANESGKLAINDGANLVNKVKATFGASKPFSFHSIIVKSNDAACKAQDGNESYGVAYEKISKATGGIISSVCEMDYSAQLQIIGEATASLVNSIQLSCVPQDMDHNGTPDITVKNSNNVTVSDYILQGQQLRFANPLAAGSYTVKYYCK